MNQNAVTHFLAAFPSIAARVDSYAGLSGSKAKTQRGKTAAAAIFYRQTRGRLHPVAPTTRRAFSQTEREDRRIIADKSFRKSWTGRQRRLLSKSMVSHVIHRTHAPLIERAKRLGINLGYPVNVVSEAQDLTATARKIASSALAIGKDYSGDVRKEFEWTSGAPSASTSTDQGDRYSSRCSYRKTDALHKVRLTVEGVRNLATLPPEVLAASVEDGLPLISSGRADTRACAAVWSNGGKPLTTGVGAIAWDCHGGRCVVYHGKDLTSARKGLAGKMEKLAERDAARVRAESGLPALWKPVVNVSDVRAFTGWCAAGCRQWISSRLGRNTSRASWAEVAKAALADSTHYGERLRELLGVTPNGPYTFPV